MSDLSRRIQGISSLSELAFICNILIKPNMASSCFCHVHETLNLYHNLKFDHEDTLLNAKLKNLLMASVLYLSIIHQSSFGYHIYLEMSFTVKNQAVIFKN